MLCKIYEGLVLLKVQIESSDIGIGALFDSKIDAIPATLWNFFNDFNEAIFLFEFLASKVVAS
jgi:hypothetical protein